MFNYQFVEGFDVTPGFISERLDDPQETIGSVGLWASAADFHTITIFFSNARPGADEPPTLSFQQAQDASGTGVKDLRIRRYHYKKGNNNLPQRDLPFTEVKFDPWVASFQLAGTVRRASLVVIDIPVSDLDVSHNFKFLRLVVPDVGTRGQRASCLYLGRRKTVRGYDQNPLL